MTQCLGCSLTFPSLDLPQCGKCTKKDQALSQTDRDIIDTRPQCSGCGVVYQWLKGILCGGCIQRSETEPQVFEDSSSITKFLTDRVNSLGGTASQHRLNQRPQNAQLQSATQVKEKISQLKKQTKSEGIDANVQLWIYPENRGGAAKKAQLPSIPAHFESGSSADHMLDELLIKIQEAYSRCPAYTETQSADIFKRDGVVFSIQNGSSVSLIDDNLLSGTVGAFFGHVKNRKLLSDRDEKAHAISLCLYIYSRSQYIETLDTDDDETPLPKSTVRKVKSCKQKLGENAPPTEASAARPPKSRASNSRTRASSSRLAYVSAYRRNTPTLTYDAIPFRRTICDVDSKTGTASLIQTDTVHTILIGQGWQTHVKVGKPAGAYISKGFTKFAFKGRFESKDYAVFQCQPAKGYTESLNKHDLIDELRLLGQAQYFLDTFYTRAKAFGVAKLPEIKWNFAGAFVGCATDMAPASLAVSSTQDDKSLNYSTFLAAPLLDMNNLNEERKFSGNEEIAKNMDPIGRIIDAYVHHALVDSYGDILFVDVQGIVFQNGSVCLFDPQAHTVDGTSGHWDKGQDKIDTYRQEHKCNSICRSLGLDKDTNDTGYSDKASGDVTVDLGTRTHPLRVGFD